MPMHSPASAPVGARLEDIDLDREDWRGAFAWPAPTLWPALLAEAAQPGLRARME